VSPVDSGNGFGTAVFWTSVIPNEDVQINALSGTAQMHIRNLPQLDYYSPAGTGDLASLGPTWQTGYFDSTVSIDVVWNRPVTRLVIVKDAANGFAGIFAENQATVTWSINSASGFSFTSNPGTFSTSVPETPGVNGVSVPLNFFAQVGFERNGIFFPAGLSNPGAAAGGPTLLLSSLGTFSSLGLQSALSAVHAASDGLAPAGTNLGPWEHAAHSGQGEGSSSLSVSRTLEFSAVQLATVVRAAQDSTFEIDWNPIVTSLVK
jgi:hypothetical protein